MRIKLSDIVINKSFTETVPNENKMIECREFWRYEGKQDRPIVLNKKNILVDGYIQYLILLEHKEEFAEVIYAKKHNRRYERLPKVEPSYKNTPTTYIYGVHPNSNCSKEFVWRVPASWGNWVDNVETGDTVLCSTKFGFAPVIVTRVKTLDECPKDFKIKKVAKKRNSQKWRSCRVLNERKEKIIMKISVSKKIMGMVIIPILFICLVAGFVTSNITKTIITDEIEIQLRTGAYGISQTLKHNDLKTEMNEEIKNLCDYTNIDVTVFKGNERIASTIDGAVGTKMDSHILEELQTGEDYFATDANVNGQPYFGYYIPFFTEDGEFSGATFTGIPQTEANKTIMAYTVKIIGCLLGYGFVFALIALFFVRKIVKAIKGLEHTVGTLLDNDLSTKHSKYDVEHDEIEEICNKTVDFSEHLGQIVTKFKDSANGLKGIASDLKEATEITTNTSNEIAIAVDDVAHGAVEQAEEATNASLKVEDISKELGCIKDNVDILHCITDSMNSAKVNAVKTLVELQRVNTVMSNDVENTNNQVSITNESVQRIKEAVELIEDVTAQTKLLSLNASIEAARAGEHGKGFAVVAEEIGKLASQSAKSSDEIKQILDDLSKNYSLIVENVQNTTNNMNVQNDKLNETKTMFNTLENNIDETVQKIANINTMVDNIDREIKAMVDTITNLSDISQENSASTEEINASVEEMKATIELVYEKAQNVDNSADMLMNEIKVFKTE